MKKEISQEIRKAGTRKIPFSFLAFLLSLAIPFSAFAASVTVDANGNVINPTKITFKSTAAHAGLNPGSVSGNPSSLSNGDLWYDSTANALKARINSISVALGAGGGGSGTIGATTNVLIGDGAGNAIASGLTRTINATGFSIAGGTSSKTFTLQNTVTVAGTDGSTLNIAGGGTLGTAAFTPSTNYQPIRTELTKYAVSGSDIASASTTNIGAATGDFVRVTGTTTITAFDNVTAGTVRTVVFTGALTLTHNATSLILPGSASIATAANDVAVFRSLGSGNWRCAFYQKADGTAVAGGAAAVPTSRTISTTSPLAGGGNLTADRTFSILNAVADGSTKGAAAFSANDFNASSGVISLDYVNATAASAVNKGFLTAADWIAFNGKAPGLSRQTFSNANVTVTAGTTTLAQIGTMSAPRTVTLPLASAYPSGHGFTLIDESGTLTASNRFSAVRAGSDTLNGDTAAVMIIEPIARFISDGTSKWIVATNGENFVSPTGQAHFKSLSIGSNPGTIESIGNFDFFGIDGTSGVAFDFTNGNNDDNNFSVKGINSIAISRPFAVNGRGTITLGDDNDVTLGYELHLTLPTFTASRNQSWANGDGTIALTTNSTGVVDATHGGTGLTALGTGVATALGVNVGSAGAFVTNGGALGTPSSGNGSNLTALNGSNISSGTVAQARLPLSSPTSYFVASDVTTTSTSFADVTGLSFSVLANKKYAITAHLVTNKNDASGMKIQFTGPGSPTKVSLRIVEGTSAANTTVGDVLQAFSTASTTFNAFNGDSFLSAWPSVISNGANAGTVTLQFECVTGGTSKVYAGSYLQVTQLD